MLELMLLAAVEAAPPPQTAEPPPPAELIEFIGDWSEEEAERFLDAPRRVPARTRGDTPESERKNVR